MIIRTPSRLHMTLIDLNGSYGRIDGGIGLTLANPQFELYGEESEKGITIEFDENIEHDTAKNECTSKVNSSAQKIIDYFNIDSGFYFKVNKAYPPHSGLGSGTQIALATSKLITELIGKKTDSIKLCEISGRGGTSGVGTFSFDHGGFIVDGGHSFKEGVAFLPSSVSPRKPPQLIGHYKFPEEWNVLVAIPKSDLSITGLGEDEIFAKYCPVPKREVEQLSHLIFMNLIPFILEKDIESVGHVINEIQDRGFKKIESNLQKPFIKNLREEMMELGAYGVGMSSFGPTLYSIYDKRNKDIVDATKELLGEDSVVFTTKAQNHGHVLYK